MSHNNTNPRIAQRKLIVTSRTTGLFFFGSRQTMEALKLLFDVNTGHRSVKHKRKAMSLFKKKKDKGSKKRKQKRKARKSKKQINKSKSCEGLIPKENPKKDPQQNPKPKKRARPKPKKKFVSVFEDGCAPMTEEEFIAFMRRLTYYKLQYMNYKMIVGIDEQIITEDTRSVLINIRKAIRHQIYNLLNVDPFSIVKSSKYKMDEIKIIELDVILPSIDETKSMH